jgi:hypothetical protein
MIFPLIALYSINAIPRHETAARLHVDSNGTPRIIIHHIPHEIEETPDDESQSRSIAFLKAAIAKETKQSELEQSDDVPKSFNHHVLPEIEEPDEYDWQSRTAFLKAVIAREINHPKIPSNDPDSHGISPEIADDSDIHRANMTPLLEDSQSHEPYKQETKTVVEKEEDEDEKESPVESSLSLLSLAVNNLKNTIRAENQNENKEIEDSKEEAVSEISGIMKEAKLKLSKFLGSLKTIN